MKFFFCWRVFWNSCQNFMGFAAINFETSSGVFVRKWYIVSCFLDLIYVPSHLTFGRWGHNLFFEVEITTINQTEVKDVLWPDDV